MGGGEDFVGRRVHTPALSTSIKLRWSPNRGRRFAGPSPRTPAGTSRTWSGATNEGEVTGSLMGWRHSAESLPVFCSGGQSQRHLRLSLLISFSVHNLDV